mmetsp:Transcript_45201/g.141659  ORF Transcript_45201/g.141659 Transcript_45201/m.141659 type:complete len:236 (+) Transcript_45201:1535-2242(+)
MLLRRRRRPLASEDTLLRRLGPLDGPPDPRSEPRDPRSEPRAGVAPVEPPTFGRDTPASLFRRPPATPCMSSWRPRMDSASSRTSFSSGVSLSVSAALGSGGSPSDLRRFFSALRRFFSSRAAAASSCLFLSAMRSFVISAAMIREMSSVWMLTRRELSPEPADAVDLVRDRRSLLLRELPDADVPDPVRDRRPFGVTAPLFGVAVPESMAPWTSVPMPRAGSATPPPVPLCAMA